MDERYHHELDHDKVILNRAEAVWGRTGLAGKARLVRRATAIIAYCGVAVGKQVLEIGCGTGTLTEYLGQTGATVAAQDLFATFLDQARVRVAAPNVSFIVGNAETLSDYTDQSFDAVCGLSILHHLNLPPTLQSIHRVLKPGGRLAFFEPNMLNPQIALQKNIPWLKKIAGDSPDETAFFRWPLVGLLHDAGFRNISIQPFDFLHPAIPDRLMPQAERLLLRLEKIPGLREIAGSLLITAEK